MADNKKWYQVGLENFQKDSKKFSNPEEALRFGKVKYPQRTLVIFEFTETEFVNRPKVSIVDVNRGT